MQLAKKKMRKKKTYNFPLKQGIYTTSEVISDNFFIRSPIAHILKIFQHQVT